MYRIIEGVATIVDREPTDLEQFGHVKILGAVRRPGLYCFSRSVPLEDIVTSAHPFPANPKYTHTCGSAALTELRISSPVEPGSQALETTQVNFVKYMKREERDGRILLRDGVIFIPEWF